MKAAWCNGVWLTPAEMPVALTDRGLLHGLALFETLLAVNGRPVFAERHLMRLARSGERLGWELPYADLPAVMAELLEKNGLASGHARIRLVFSAGSGPLNDLSPGADRLVWIVAFPAPAPPQLLNLQLSPWPRNERSPLAGLKCASYAENLIALDHARRQGFDETLFLNTVGQLCEAATANVFLVKNGRILTPGLDSGCLSGVGREVILELATCVESTLTWEDVETADEVFLSSATRGAMSVSRIGDRFYAPGEVTASVRAAWDDLIAEQAEI